MLKIRTIHGTITLGEPINEAAPSIPDSYGESVGIHDKSSYSYRKDLPESGPIGSISDSAWANLNVPTRGIPGTSSKKKPGSGNLGCAAAVSIMFYRATGYPIIPGKKIVLGTSTLWGSFSKSKDWEKITDWRNNYQPGDIILTSKGSQSGHVGIVVEDGQIISNSSGGFQGDKKGQIEKNYSVNSWEKVAARNPDKTAIFRYKGKYRDRWNGEGKTRTEDQSGNSGTMSHITSGKPFKWGSGPDDHGKQVGNWRSDNAYDLIAPEGTPILSIVSGKISDIVLSDSSDMSIFGWNITIKSDSGNEVFYTYLGKLESDIKVNSKIKLGDLIGYIGRPSNIDKWTDRVHIATSSGDLKDYIDNGGNIKGSGDRPLVDPNNSQSSNTEDLVSKGDTGEEVKRIQEALIAAGIPLPKYGVDSKYGDETEDAVRQFQKANPPLEVDGIVGPETRPILFGNKVGSDADLVEIPTSPDSDGAMSKIATETISKVNPIYIGKKFKVYDSDKKKVIVAHLQSDGNIILKSKIGKYLGGTRRDSNGKLQIFYNDLELNIGDLENSIVTGIINIFKAVMIVSSTKITDSDAKPDVATDDVPVNTDVKVETPSSESGLGPILKLTVSGESFGDYNIYNFGKSGSSGIRTSTKGSRYYNSGAYVLTNLTINQILDLQSTRKIFAAGKYQTIPKTLRAVATKLGLLNSKFDVATQDKIGEYLFIGGKRPALAAYLKGSNSGSKNDLEKAVQALGQEFASKPIIVKNGVRWGNVETGEGNKAYYGGKGPNPDTVKTTVGTVVVNLIKSRKQYSRKDPEFIPNYYKA